MNTLFFFKKKTMTEPSCVFCGDKKVIRNCTFCEISSCDTCTKQRTDLYPDDKGFYCHDCSEYLVGLHKEEDELKTKKTVTFLYGKQVIDACYVCHHGVTEEGKDTCGTCCKTICEHCTSFIDDMYPKDGGARCLACRLILMGQYPRCRCGAIGVFRANKNRHCHRCFVKMVYRKVHQDIRKNFAWTCQCNIHHDYINPISGDCNFDELCGQTHAEHLRDALYFHQSQKKANQNKTK